MQAQGAQAGDGDAGRSLGLVLETTDHGAAREPSLAGAEAAQARVAKYGLRTPLLKANIGDDGGGMEVLLKAENLQPIRSYKVGLPERSASPRSLPAAYPVGLGNVTHQT